MDPSRDRLPAGPRPETAGHPGPRLVAGQAGHSPRADRDEPSPRPAVSNGQGKPGFCKICVHPAAQFLNARVEREGKDVFNAARAAELAKELDLTFSRQTWYAHLDHITHPLVTAVEESKKNPVIAPKTTTGALEMIRDLGIKRAIENPEEVTVDHGLKAMAELNKKATSTDSVTIVLAKIMSGEVAPEVIVGEWTEALPGSQEDSPIGEA